MSLKLIPVEIGGTERNRGKKQKIFNPGYRIKRKNSSGGLKNICLRLIHFINRGSRFTYQQIDELIMSLQKSILSLQKKKQQILQKKSK